MSSVALQNDSLRYPLIINSFEYICRTGLFLKDKRKMLKLSSLFKYRLHLEQIEASGHKRSIDYQAKELLQYSVS